MKNLTLHIADMLEEWLHDFTKDYSSREEKEKFAEDIIDVIHEDDKEAWEARNER